MTEQDIRSIESTLRNLKELVASPGWAIIKETMKDDLLQACLQLADDPNMTNKEIDFRRGAIAAARNFVNVPELLISKFESDAYLASAENQTHFNLNATAYPDTTL
jgi:hypothetical protein